MRASSLPLAYLTAHLGGSMSRPCLSPRGAPASQEPSPPLGGRQRASAPPCDACQASPQYGRRGWMPSITLSTRCRPYKGCRVTTPLLHSQLPPLLFSPFLPSACSWRWPCHRSPSPALWGAPAAAGHLPLLHSETAALERRRSSCPHRALRTDHIEQLHARVPDLTTMTSEPRLRPPLLAPGSPHRSDRRYASLLCDNAAAPPQLSLAGHARGPADHGGLRPHLLQAH